MHKFKSEKQAFKSAGDKIAAMCKEGFPNCGLRVLKYDDGFKVLILPDRSGKHFTPFYLNKP